MIIMTLEEHVFVILPDYFMRLLYPVAVVVAVVLVYFQLFLFHYESHYF